MLIVIPQSLSGQVSFCPLWPRKESESPISSIMILFIKRVNKWITLPMAMVFCFITGFGSLSGLPMYFLFRNNGQMLFLQVPQKTKYRVMMTCFKYILISKYTAASIESRNTVYSATLYVFTPIAIAHVTLIVNVSSGYKFVTRKINIDILYTEPLFWYCTPKNMNYFNKCHYFLLLICGIMNPVFLNRLKLLCSEKVTLLETHHLFRLYTK